MANPCAFSYTNKNGELVSFSTKEEFAKALYDGLLDDFIKDKKITEKSTKVIVEKSIIQDLKNQTYDVFKAGVQAITATKATSKAKLKSIIENINSLAMDENDKAKKGVLTTKQVNALVKRVGLVNIDNPKKVNELLDYAEKIFNDAEHKDSIDKLKDVIDSIKNKIGSKNIDAEARAVAKKFASIKISNVRDIDKHIEIANAINEGLKPSSVRGENLKVSSVFDKKEITQYVISEIKNQESEALQQRMNDFYESTGLEPSEFNLDEIEAIINDEKDIKDTELDSATSRSKIKSAFDSLKKIINDSLETGKDRFTGEDNNFTPETIDSIEKLSKVDFNLLSNKDGLLLIDIMNDIQVNGYSNKLDSFLNDYDGKTSAKEFEKGKSATKLKLFFSGAAGRFWNKQIGGLYSVAETMFRGFDEGNKFMKAMGFDEIQRGATIAEMHVNRVFSKYSEMFLKTTPNKQPFNSEFNNAERTFSAMMNRFTPGMEEEDFARNKELIAQSIEYLGKGDDKQKKLSKTQEEVYNKIIEGSKSREDVLRKTDPTNVRAINEMSKNHKVNFAENAKAALKYYNTILVEDENYNTVKYSRLESDSKQISEDAFDSAIVNREGKVYDKKAGVFNESRKPSLVKKGRYIDTNFEMNNEQAMRSSLVDAKTAPHIKKMKGFIYSDSFENIIRDRKDRELFISRLKSFVDIKRGRNYPPIGKEEIAAINKFTKTVSKMAAVKALGGITQLPKQTISVGASTLINSGSISVIDAFDSDWNDLIDNSGYEIATRGVHSSADYKKIESILRSVENSKYEHIAEKIGDAQNFYLEKFLAKPDVFIARASWISYYKEGLKKNGIDPSSIDLKNHEINKDAAFYAQRQVDRQQNVSDTALEGKWLTSKDPGAELSRAILLPFAKFSLNQKSRMYSDFHTAFNKNASASDRKIALKSLVALSVEQAVFRVISATISAGIYKSASALMGHEEDEEEKDKQIKNIISNQLRSSVADYASPLPFMDFPVQYGISKVADFAQEQAGVEEKINIAPYMDRSYLDRFGMYGIVAKGTDNLIKYQQLAWTGKYEENGKEIEITDDAQNTLKMLSTANFLYHAGYLPAEFNSLFLNMEKIAKKERKKKDINWDVDSFEEKKDLFKNRKSLFN